MTLELEGKQALKRSTGAEGERALLDFGAEVGTELA